MTDIPASVWTQVQEALYQRWVDGWTDGAGAPLSPGAFADEGFDPPAALWFRFSVQRQPGAQATLGRVGNRRFDRVGRVSIQLFVPPGDGIALISNAADFAAKLFEGCSVPVHGIHFAEVEPGPVVEDMEQGRWTGCTTSGRFTYQEIR